MAILNILTYPDPFLKEPTKPVEEIDDTIRKLAADMAETMYAAPGIGLAANQVGIDKSVVVYDIKRPEDPENYQVIINPRIVASSGTTVSEQEGCLSVPNFRADVRRAERITVNALDLDGNQIEIKADGFLATALQHEIDHLNGILFIDRISRLKKEIYVRRMKKQLKKA